MKKLKSAGWFLLALFTCPCHLLLIIPLLAGTAFGAYIAEYQTVTYVVLGLLFAYSMFMGLIKINKTTTKN